MKQKNVGRSKIAPENVLVGFFNEADYKKAI